MPGGGTTIIDHQVIDLDVGAGRRPPPQPTGVAPVADGVPASDVVSVSDVPGCRSTGRAVSTASMERLNGHAVVIPIRGRARYLVDFVQHVVRPGLLLHVQPGQIVQWPTGVGFEADVVFAAAGLCPTELFDEAGEGTLMTPGAAAAAIRAVADDIVRERAEAEPDPAVLAAAARYLLHRVARAGADPHPAGPQRDLLRAFRSELERSYFTTRSVSYYAGAIGASPKTLSRATSALTGSSPKELIDRRVTLEARRLLAHTTYRSSAIGAMLGFSEPTNFTKFFVRHTGDSPQQFRVSID